MRRDNIRDYATSAFAFYAQSGGLKKYKDEKYNELLWTIQKWEVSVKAGISDPTAAAHVRAEAEMEGEEIMSEIADLKAVEQTLDFLPWLRTGREMRKAIDLVYFIEPQQEIEGDIIHERVHQASLRIPASERQVYRWLADARAVFAKYRGIRLEGRHIFILNRLHL